MTDSCPFHDNTNQQFEVGILFQLFFLFVFFVVVVTISRSAASYSLSSGPKFEAKGWILVVSQKQGRQTLAGSCKLLLVKRECQQIYMKPSYLE